MIKLIRIFLIVVLILAIGFFVAVHFYVKNKGRRIVIDYLAPAFDRDIYSGGVSYRFPFTLELNGLNIQGALGFDRAILRMGFPDWRNKRLVFSEVILQRPGIVIQRDKGGQWDWGYFARSKYRGGPSGSFSGQEGQSAESHPETGLSDTGEEKASFEQPIPKTIEQLFQIGIYIKKLTIGNGQINYIDHSLKSPEVRVPLESIYLRMSPVIYPFGEQRTSIDATGTVGETTTTPFKDRWFKLTGWFDLGRRDMDMDLKVIDSDGTPGLEADLISRQNDMKVSGRMRIKTSDLNEGSPLKASVFPDDFGGKINLVDIDMDVSFSFKTQMDRFRIDRVSIEGNLDFEGFSEISGSKEE